VPSPRIAFLFLAPLSILAAPSIDAAPYPTLQPGQTLEAALAAGDQTGQKFIAAFVPDHDGPWTISLESPYFDASLEVRRLAAGAASERLGRIHGEKAVNPSLTVEAAARETLEVIVEGDEHHACGATFRLTARAGPRPSLTDADRVEAQRRYWQDLLDGAVTEGNAACEVRSLLGQDAAVRRAGHLQEAGDLVDRAIATAEERMGPTSAFLAWALNAKGRLRREETKMDEALPLHERAAALLEARYGPVHPVTADALADLAAVYGDLDRDQEAEALYRRVLDIREKTLPPGTMDIGGTLVDLAGSCVNAGDLAGARVLIERALAIAEAQVPQDPGDIAAVLGSLAYVERRLGDDESARHAYERAIATYRDRIPNSRKPIARLTALLARVVDDMGDEKDARDLYEQALVIDLDIYGKEHATPANIELRIARLLARDGHFDEARQRAAKAVAVFETTLGPRHSRTATALETDAEIERMAGDPDKALALIDRAIAIGEALLGEAHPDLARPLRLRAALDADLGRSDAALAAALRAEDLGRDQLRLTARALSEETALRYAATRPRGLDLALRLAASATGPAPDLDRTVWDGLIRSRALVLDEMARRRLLLANGDPETARLRGDLARAGARLARLLVRAAEGDAPGDILPQIEASRRERDLKEEAFAARSATFEAERRDAATGYEAIARRLSPDEALVSYARVDRAAGGRHRPGTRYPEAPPDEVYVAFVLRGSAGTPRLVLLGDAAAIETAVARWRSALTAAPAGLGVSRAGRDRDARAAGVALRSAIWDPVATALGDSGKAQALRTLFVVPDGALALVNVAALPRGESGFLIEDPAVIQMLSAERDLTGRDLAADANAASAPGRALIVGGPDFDAGAGARPARLFPPLPEAAGEAGDVAAALRHAHLADVTLLTGRAATPSAFERLAPGSRYIHLATHAFWHGADLAAGAAAPLADALVRGTLNPLDVSGVALSGANRRAPEAEDGLLTALEVATLDLTAADWVVLSGCDTGIGPNAPGEGLLGLQRAFRVAGARGLVVSLWQVPDLATREWMKLVYAEARAGISPAAALRGASRRWLAAQRRAGASTSPEVWGAFIVTGPFR
jgi:CHAT domain-containing protein